MLIAVDNRSENSGRTLRGLRVLSTATNVSRHHPTRRGESFVGHTQSINSPNCPESLHQSGVLRVITVIPSPYGYDDREKNLTIITIGNVAV